MKGTANLLVLDETYNDRKAFILSCIIVARNLIKAIQSTSNKFASIKEIAPEVIKCEQQYIKDQFTELTQLERWRIKEGLGKDEPFKYKSLRSRTDTQATGSDSTVLSD